MAVPHLVMRAIEAVAVAVSEPECSWDVGIPLCARHFDGNKKRRRGIEVGFRAGRSQHLLDEKILVCVADFSC